MLLTLLGLSLLASAPPIPPPTCQTANGRTACGYFCKASFSEVRCASTPYGTCSTFDGRVYCFDPPASAIHHPPDEGLRPECKGVAGQAACGFNCLVAKGKVACARTPYGVCREHDTELSCFDPPILTQCAHSQPPDPEQIRKPKSARVEPKTSDSSN